MKYASFNLFLIGALIVALSPSSAHAAGMKGPASASRRLTRARGPKERECEFSAKNDEVEFECKSKSSGRRDLSEEKEDEVKEDEVKEDEVKEDEVKEDEVKEEEVKEEVKEEEVKEKEEKEDESKGDVETRGISIIPDETIKDKIKYKVVTTDEGIRVKLEYKNEVETQGTETETKTKFDLLFISLVEYVKGSNDTNDEAYDWDADEIVQTIPLTQWQDISGVMNDDVGVVSYFSATTMDMSALGGSAMFNFTVARADQGEHITANSMKIDVHILDFPWTRSDSYVALMSTLESKLKVKVDYETQSVSNVNNGETSVSRSDKQSKSKRASDVIVSFGSEMPETLGWTTFGEYTWAKDAKVDAALSNATMAEDMTIEVIATSPINQGNETYQSIAYSFVGPGAQGASDIYWDPTTGIGYESAAGWVLQSSMHFAAAMVGVLLLATW